MFIIKYLKPYDSEQINDCNWLEMISWIHIIISIG